MTTIDPRAIEAFEREYSKHCGTRGLLNHKKAVASALSAAQPFMVREGLTQDRLDKLSDDIAEAVQWWQIKGPKDREWKGIMEFVQGVIDKIPAASPPPSAEEVERLKQACDALGDSAGHRAVQTDSSPCLICDLITAARAAIAAMNRAPQTQGVCNKCGYCGPIGPQGEHPNCNYQALALAPKQRVPAEDMARFRKECAGGYISNADAISIILNLIDDLTDARSALGDLKPYIARNEFGRFTEITLEDVQSFYGPCRVAQIAHALGDGRIVGVLIKDDPNDNTPPRPQRSYEDVERAMRFIIRQQPLVGVDPEDLIAAVLGELAHAHELTQPQGEGR